MCMLSQQHVRHIAKLNTERACHQTHFPETQAQILYSPLTCTEDDATTPGSAPHPTGVPQKNLDL